MDNLQVGRELDTEIAEKVMGWQPVTMNRGFSWNKADGNAAMSDWVTRKSDLPTILPYFSISIADAWQVVEHIRQRDDGARSAFMLALRNEPRDIGEANKDIDTLLMDPFWWFMFYADAPEAICRAALMVVDNERKEV